MRPVSSALGRCFLLLVFLPYLLFGASCPDQVANPADCTNDESLCTKNGLVCDPVIHSCVKSVGCLSAAMCSQATASVCTGGQCEACSEDAQCAAWSQLRNVTPARSFCVSLDQQNTCAECRPGMDTTDCTNPLSPVCDSFLGICRPCRANKDCPSQICRKRGDYPETAPIPGLTTGQCVPASQIAYVDQDADGCLTTGTDSTPDKPFCSVAAALKTDRVYVSIAPSVLYYANLTVDLPDQTRVLVAPSADTRSYAIHDHITVKNGTLVLENLYLLPITATAPALTCTGAASSLYVMGGLLLNANKLQTRLIDASADCRQLVVDRSQVSCFNTPKYGILVGGAGPAQTSFRIVNTQVLSCGGGAMGNDPVAIQLNEGATGYFGFNVVVGNYQGILCKTATQTVVNSIFTQNNAANITGCTFSPEYNITDAAKVDYTSPPYLKINSAKNAMYIFDKGLPPPDKDMVPVDADGNPRPQGAGYDIGIQELK